MRMLLPHKSSHFHYLCKPCCGLPRKKHYLVNWQESPHRGPLPYSFRIMLFLCSGFLQVLKNFLLTVRSVTAPSASSIYAFSRLTSAASSVILIKESDAFNGVSNCSSFLVKSCSTHSLCSGIHSTVADYIRVEEELVGLYTTNGIKINSQSEHFGARIYGTMHDPEKGHLRNGVSIDEAKKSNS